MKNLLVGIALFGSLHVFAQNAENIIVITIDGYRWQELFGGMDETLANSKQFNQEDSGYLFRKYGGKDVSEKRNKLMPFFWNTIAAKGQLYGNRWENNKVNIANQFGFSYPGYSEILCGYADPAINSNEFASNPNTTVLEFLNRQKKVKNKVAAFSAWDAFNRIINSERSGIPVVAGFNNAGGESPTANEKLINDLRQDIHREWKDECFDVFVHYAAMEELKNRKPKVLYVAYGETDEWAHFRQYRSYLDAAHSIDGWIKEIWDFVQSDPQYKDKTALLITTDHGRGDKYKEKWTSHGLAVEGAEEIWLAVLGPDTPASGEMKMSMQLYQNQIAQTIAKLIGFTFKAEHPVGDEIRTAFK